MSTKAVIVWLGLAVLLGGIAMFLLSVPTRASSSTDLAQGAALFAFQASNVEAIRVIRADGQEEIIERTPPAVAAMRSGETQSAIGAESEWRLRIVPSAQPSANRGSMTAAGPAPWPVPSAQVQSLLRILADLRSLGVPPKDAELGKGIQVRISLKDGSDCGLSLAERTLAGTCFATTICGVPAAPHDPAARIARNRALVDAKIHDLFTNPGPLGWREQSFLTTFAPQASRIRLENPRQTLALGKIDGRWSIREPVTAPADPAAVQKLIGELSRVRIVDFLDGGTGDLRTGLDTPTAQLVVEQDVRSISTGAAGVGGEPVVSTVRCGIVVGAAADASASRLFATIDAGRVVLLESESLANLSMDPIAYLWPHPTRLVPADIGMVVLAKETSGDTGSALRRVAGRWSRLATDGTESVLIDKDLANVETLLAFLTGAAKPSGQASSADRPSMTIEAPEQYRAAGRISLRSLAGDAIESVEVGLAQPGVVVLRSGSVYRTYPEARVPTLILELIAGAPPAQSKKETGPVEMNK